MSGNRTIRFFVSYINKLPQVTDKEKSILTSRIKSVTLTKIGKKYKVTEGRIRQIEKVALKKIKDKLYQMKLFKS